MARSSEATKEKIIEALRAVLVRDGFREAGVNAVAREAGVDKVLIYRYFGGMEGLLGRFAQEAELWPPNRVLLGGEPREMGHLDAAELCILALKALARELGKNPLALEVMRWELVERNGLTDALAGARDRQMRELLELVTETGGGKVTGEDVAGVAALLSAGIQHILLGFGSTEAGGEEVEEAVEQLVRVYFMYLKYLKK